MRDRLALYWRRLLFLGSLRYSGTIWPEGSLHGLVAVKAYGSLHITARSWRGLTPLIRCSLTRLVRSCSAVLYVAYTLLMLTVLSCLWLAWSARYFPQSRLAHRSIHYRITRLAQTPRYLRRFGLTALFRCSPCQRFSSVDEVLSFFTAISSVSVRTNARDHLTSVVLSAARGLLSYRGTHGCNGSL